MGWLALLLLAACSGDDGPRPPDLVLITVDTLRADRLGCHGHDRPTSPAIDRLAAEGLRFENALSQAPWTLPSLASIHTSLYPSEHGALSYDTPLSSDLATLAEALGERGYRTVGVVTHDFAGRSFGFDQGFDVFDDSLAQGHRAVTSEQLTQVALELTAERDERPLFLWVHYFDPHYTYMQQPDFDFAEEGAEDLPDNVRYRWLIRKQADCSERELEFVRAVYDEEIAFTDRSIGALVEGLRAAGGERPLVVALTGDHGEAFLERGRFGHGESVHAEQVHVPLILSGAIDPRLRGVSEPAPVEVSSLAYTLARLAGDEAPAFRGVDLLDPDRARLSGRACFSEGSYADGSDRRSRAVVAGDWKLIEQIDDGRVELYHRGSDPAELRDLAASTAPEVLSARRALGDLLATFRPQGLGLVDKLDLEPALLERLREMGYVD